MMGGDELHRPPAVALNGEGWPKYQNRKREIQSKFFGIC